MTSKATQLGARKASAPLRAQTSIPVIAAPMFLVSTPELVVACCKAGVIGTLPAHNCATTQALGETLAHIAAQLARCRTREPDKLISPFGVNVILHKTNPRARQDLECCVEHKVPLVITSLGKPSNVIQPIHAHGGLVFSAVATVEHARKAAASEVDGLILVCAGAGGHAGTMNPLAFVPAVREFFDGIIAVSGAITTGRAIRVCEVLGADFAYMGTRFLATVESGADPAHKEMVVSCGPEDLIYTAAVTGVPAHFLRPSLERAGYDLGDPSRPRLSLDMADPDEIWRRVWTAGQGLGMVHSVPTVAELVAQLEAEYAAALHP